MGNFYEEISLTNARDMGNAREGAIPNAEVRTVTVNAMPDTGVWTLVINEDTRQKLGLSVIGTVTSSLADGSRALFGLTEPVEVRWKNRSIMQQAVVVPDARDVLLGALPLEGMDLCVDPVHQCLKGAHGDEPLHVLYAFWINRNGLLHRGIAEARRAGA